MGSDDGRGQRGWVLAAWDDVGGRAGRVVGLVSVGGRGQAWSARVGMGRHGQQGWAWEAYSVWVGVGGKGWCGQHGWVGAGGLSSGQRFN